MSANINIGRNATMIKGDSRLDKGRRVKILGYVKTDDEYYVRVEDGCVCHYVKAQDVVVDED